MAWKFNPFSGTFDLSGGEKGDAGATGAAGSRWLLSEGVPGAGLGVDSDFALDTLSGDIYGPKAGGVWGAAVYNIAEGQQGVQGDPGTDGSDGADGAGWLAAEGVPGVGDGVDGDFYLDTLTGDIYGPKSAGAWGASVYNIAEGQQGPAGQDGADGEDGSPGAPGPVFVDVVIPFTIEGLDVVTGVLPDSFPVTSALTGVSYELVCTNAPAGTVLIVDVRRNGTTVFGANKLNIDATETSSSTAATPADVVTTALSQGDVLTFDVIQTGVLPDTGRGLKLILRGTVAP
jgi:hypothetical protein